MNLAGKKALITGAAGGIGAELARQLSLKGVTLMLTDVSKDALEKLASAIAKIGPTPGIFDADVSNVAECEAVVSEAKLQLGQIDILVNVAGIMTFNEFPREELSRIELLHRVNTLAPQILSRLVLPEMIERRSGLLVNIGSMFGSIAFPYHATYSSSKFAVRGFSEALRRELSGSGVGVLYVSPRATRTGLTDERMAAATGMQMDSPQHVGERIVAAVEHERKECFIGFPESLFARINGILPRVIDIGLKKQTALLRPFATRS